MGYDVHAAAPAKSLVHFSLVELQEGLAETQAKLHQALRTEGAIVVRGIPGYEGTAEQTFDELGACFLRMDGQTENGDDGPFNTVISTGVKRSTLATSMAAGSSQPLPARAVEECPRLRDPAARLRAIFDWLVMLFARSVDTMAIDAKAEVLRPRGELAFTQHQSLLDAARSGTRLEHFHRYASPGNYSTSGGESIDEKNQAIQMHTDMGLFQALAIQWRARDGLSLEVQLPDGSMVSAEPSIRPSRIKPAVGAKPSAQATEGDGILFLIGQGLTEWMPHLGFRAAPHALVRSPPLEADRLVYGVMVLPPPEWPLMSPSGSNTTFGEWWRRAQSALQSTSSSRESSDSVSLVGAFGSPGFRAIDPMGPGCLSSGTLHRKLADVADSCTAGDIYCWMQCVTTAHLSCAPENAMCVSDAGQICVADEDHVHDASCTPRCPWGDSTSPGVAGDFCNGIMTDMHMTGFEWSGEASPCLILLFPGWELTDGARFWLAVAGTVLAGVFAEFLIYVRRRQRTSSDRQVLRLADRVWQLFLYTGNRTLGYFVMLITMTYSVELFMAVIVGLSIGHAIFNLGAPSGEDMTPCCQSGHFSSGVSGQAIGKEDGKYALRANEGDRAKQGDRARFVVLGMTCGICVTAVRRAVETASGVGAVTELSLESGLLEVEFKPSSNIAGNIQQICQVVQDVGFSVVRIHLDGGGQDA
jgi:copper chaperone CopZ